MMTQSASDNRVQRGSFGRILLTGATGLIGSRLLPQLLARDDQEGVVVATRRPEQERTTGGDVETWSLDLGREFNLPRDIRTVFHLAGEKRDVSRMQDVNEGGALRLVEAAASVGAATFVHLSSVGVYGAPRNAGRVSESRPHAPNNEYESTKSRGETLVLERCRSHGIEAIVLQPSNVVGYVPERTFPLLGLVRAVRQGRFTWFGRKSGWTNYVGVDDVASAILAAAGHAPGHAAYIVNTPAPLETLVSWIAEETGVDYPRRQLPGALGFAAAATGSALERLTGRSMPFDLPRLRELTNDTYFDPSLLLRTAGFQYPQGAESTIRTLVRRYVQEGLV